MEITSTVKVVHEEHEEHDDDDRMEHIIMQLIFEKDLKVKLLLSMKSEIFVGVFGLHGLFDEFKIVGEESIFLEVEMVNVPN